MPPPPASMYGYFSKWEFLQRQRNNNILQNKLCKFEKKKENCAILMGFFFEKEKNVSPISK